MVLRPYQIEIDNGITAGWREFKRQLAVCATGGGKTTIMAAQAKANLPGRTLILAHRGTLVDQAIGEMASMIGVKAGKEQSDHSADMSDMVVVGTVQTMRSRLERWPKNHFRLVIADEAHHSISLEWQTVLNHFDAHANILGLTATPDRGDKRNLGTYYQNIAAEVGLFDLVHQGYLARPFVKTVPLKIDLNAVKVTAGDFAESGLGDALEPYLEQIARAIVEHAGYRKTLVFLPLIATSQKFCEACRNAGLRAEHVDGMSKDQDEILRAFDGGAFDVLCNAMLLTEGYNCKSIDCVVVLRPTRSRPLFSQMVGRGTRLCPGKENLLLLDFLWMHETHRIIHPAHLVANSNEEAEIITKKAEEKSGGQEELELEGLVSETQWEREKALREKLEALKKRKGTTISAEEFALQQNRMDIAEYEPVMAWEGEGLTEAQTRVLKGMRIDPRTVRGKGHASKLIGMWYAQPASQAEKAVMLRMRIPGAEKATRGEAKRFFAGLRKSK